MRTQDTRQPRGAETVKSIIQDSIQSTKMAAATSGATVGASAWLEWIPSDISKLGMVIGIALSGVLIYCHLRKTKRDDEKHELEMKILKRKDNE